MSAKSTIRLGAFKAWLSVWISAAMVAGLLLGTLWPSVFLTLGSLSISEINPITAILVWLLILPTMVGIDYSRFGSVWSTSDWRAGSAITLGVWTAPTGCSDRFVRSGGFTVAAFMPLLPYSKAV